MFEDKENEALYANIKKEETTTYDNQTWNHLKVNHINKNNNNDIESTSDILNSNNNNNNNNSHSLLSSICNDVKKEGIKKSSISLDSNCVNKSTVPSSSSNSNNDFKENLINDSFSICNPMEETIPIKNSNHLSVDSSDDEILIHKFQRQKRKQDEAEKEKPKEIKEEKKEEESKNDEEDSEDDECILNLIKQADKNKKVSEGRENDANSSDSSSYDSDEPILMQSKLKYKNKGKQNTTNKINTKHSSEIGMTQKSKNVRKSSSTATATKRATRSPIKRCINGSNRKRGSNSNSVSKSTKSVKKTAQKKIQKAKKNTKSNKNGKNTKSKNAKSKKTSGKDKEKGSILIGSFDPYNRSSKEKLVAQLLVRWWYVLPDWPPQDYCYDEKLKEMKLKVVSLEEYESKKDVDEQGFKKVYQISAFPGLFRDVLGNAYDLRDKDTCPSYNNFIKKSEHELLELICEAIKKQLECLKNSVYDESENIKKLERELKEAETKLNKLTKKNKGKTTVSTT